MKEMEMVDWEETMERLESVADALEQAAERIAEQQVALAAEAQQSVGRIVGTVETAREAELERRLAEAEQKITELTAAATQPAAAARTVGRSTLPAGVVSMLAKQGVSVEAHGALPQEPAALDGALASLSIEQRIAVKAELMRAGLI